jgi:hypothetical protein
LVALDSFRKNVLGKSIRSWTVSRILNKGPGSRVKSELLRIAHFIGHALYHYGQPPPDGQDLSWHTIGRAMRETCITLPIEAIRHFCYEAGLSFLPEPKIMPIGAASGWDPK